jgi:hypothetical protein
VGAWHGGGQLGAAGNGPRPSGMGDVGDGVSVTDGRDRGEAVGCRHVGPSGTVLGGAVQTGF